MNSFKILTALITPFKQNGNIDYDAFEDLIIKQLEEGVDGFIVCGTTAETPCLTQEEKFSILLYVLEKTKHKVEVWFGCGSNNTAETLRNVVKASYYDIDGVLLVTPYYNKPSQEGLYQHFKTIADEVDIPIMLYQVPSRCGVTFEEATLYRLFQDCPNIVALKHASNTYDIIERLHQSFPHIQLYSGEDKTFMKGINKGLSGLVSVMSNYNVNVIRSYVDNPTSEKEAFLLDLSSHTFLECSPCAIKYLLYKQGVCQNILRLPLVPISTVNQEKLDEFLKKYNI